MSKYVCIVCNRVSERKGRFKCIRCRHCGSHRALHITLYEKYGEQPERWIDAYLAAKTRYERDYVKKHGILPDSGDRCGFGLRSPKKQVRIYVCKYCGRIITDRPHGKRVRKFCSIKCWSLWANEKQGKGLDKPKQNE